MRKVSQLDKSEDKSSCQDGTIVRRQCGWLFFRTGFEESGAFALGEYTMIIERYTNLLAYMCRSFCRS